MILVDKKEREKIFLYLYNYIYSKNYQDKLNSFKKSIIF